MNPFLEGLLAGYGIAIPIGAIAVLIIETALRQGFRFGFTAGAGAATADIFYATLAMLAGVAVASRIAPFSLGLRVTSALVLFALGGYGLWRTRSTSGDDRIETEHRKKRGVLATYFQFLALTLLNPLTIVYFGALILAREAGSTTNTTDRFLFVIGAGLASLSWQTLLAGTGAVAKRYLSDRFRLYVSVAGYLIVIALGMRIIVQILQG